MRQLLLEDGFRIVTDFFLPFYRVIALQLCCFQLVLSQRCHLSFDSPPVFDCSFEESLDAEDLHFVFSSVRNLAKKVVLLAVEGLFSLDKEFSYFKLCSHMELGEHSEG